MKKNENRNIPVSNGSAKPKINRLAIKYLIGIISFLCILLLSHREMPQTKIVLSAGEIANHDIRAEVDFRFIDKKATELQQEASAEKVPDIYYIDQEMRNEAEGEINNLFDTIAESKDPSAIMEKFPWMEDGLILKMLLQQQNPQQIEENILKIYNELFDKGIITNSLKIKVISGGRDSISLYDYTAEKIDEINIEKFIVYDDLDSVLESRLKMLHPFNRHLRQVIKYILAKQIKPNILYDTKEVEKQKETAKKEIAPVYRYIKKGQIIVRKGDPVIEFQKTMLSAHDEELNRLRPKISHLSNTVGNLLLLGILFIILVTYLHYHQPEIFSCNKRILLLSIIIISTLFIARLMVYLSASIEKPFWDYFIVVPIGAMLIAVLMDRELAILSSMIMSIMAAVFAGRSLGFTVIILFGSIVSIQYATGIIHRWKFIMAGVFIGLANAVAILMVNLINLYSPELLSWKTIGYQALGGFVSGLACAMVVDIYMPILEKLFNITTDIRLLELSDLNHPLLKMMITEAPGTYHHSIMVSNLAEDAASSIGANSLLAKVGGYFHDIGKVTKPEYFAENIWFEKESRHEKLFPSMSNIVITAHVKDGLQLAKKYKLPNAILDIIKEHHGTSLVYYFYKKAEKESNKENGEIIEADFRYPGPKPHNKEAGIILLADAIEAASHALIKPTHSKIEELVREISLEKINDGQLDDCGLTLRDINIIRGRFTHILTGILHKRIEYPKEIKE